MLASDWSEMDNSGIIEGKLQSADIFVCFYHCCFINLTVSTFKPQSIETIKACSLFTGFWEWGARLMDNRNVL